MNESIVQLGRWLAESATGAVNLRWSDGELLVRARSGELVALLGIPSECVARQLGVEPTGESDLVAEARAIALRVRIRDAETRDALISCLQAGLREWLIDPERTLELSLEEPDEPSGSGVYVPHAVVDLVLTDEQDLLAATILPDPHVPLQRTARFDAIYNRLQPSEEADLIVAKITGQRTADDIASRSPHGANEVLRLLAGLVAGGLAEVAPKRTETAPTGPTSEEGEVGDVPLEVTSEDAVTPERRPLPWRWLLAAVGVALVILIALVWALNRSTDERSAPVVPPMETEQQWTIVVDMGCEPGDLARIVKKVNRFPQDLRTIQTAEGDSGDDQDSPCWRLVWSEFGSREDAEAALEEVPNAYVPEGFEPHVVPAAPMIEEDSTP